MSKSAAEATLALQLRALGIEFEREVRVSERQWRWDFKVLDVLIDIQGGIWMGQKKSKDGTNTAGRHPQGKGYQNDCDKANEAVLRGYRVLRFTTEDVKKGKAVKGIEEALNWPGGVP
jgi:very-short-patch-repair endonuclease